MEFASAGFNEPSLVWRFREKIHGFHYPMEARALPEFMAKSGPRLAILPASEMAQTFPTLPPTWRAIGPVDGFNVANGRKTALCIVLKPE